MQVIRLNTEHRDITTGVVAPPGPREVRTLGGLDLRIPAIGAKLQGKGRDLIERADMWSPGNNNVGVEIGPDGQLLPAIKHMECRIPLTDILGGDLQMSDAEKEAIRRSWYARQMRAAPRLTPVHHIIGESEPQWRGRMRSIHRADRDAWRSMLWEPENLAQLQTTYYGLYDIDWGKLPDDTILAPLERRLQRMSRAEMATAELEALRLRRSRAELAVLKRVGVLVQAGKDAAQAHAEFKDIAERYTEAAQEIRAFTAAPL